MDPAMGLTAGAQPPSGGTLSKSRLMSGATNPIAGSAEGRPTPALSSTWCRGVLSVA